MCFFGGNKFARTSVSIIQGTMGLSFWQNLFSHFFGWTLKNEIPFQGLHYFTRHESEVFTLVIRKHLTCCLLYLLTSFLSVERQKAMKAMRMSRARRGCLPPRALWLQTSALNVDLSGRHQCEAARCSKYSRGLSMFKFTIKVSMKASHEDFLQSAYVRYVDPSLAI